MTELAPVKAINAECRRRDNQKLWKRYIELVQGYPEAKEARSLYASARGYDSWPFVHAHLLSLCMALSRIILDKSLPKTDEVAICAESASAALVALASDAPLRHLGADLARAFIATKPLLCLGESQMPYPAFLLNLPRGLLLDDQGANVNTIIVMSHGYWIAKCLDKGIKVNLTDSKMSDGGLFVVGLADDGTQIARTTCWNDAHLSSVDEETFCSGFDETAVAGAIDRMMRIALNSMSAMTWRKDLLEVENITTGAGFGTRQGSLKQRPIYWIGKNYARKNQPNSSPQISCGTKAPHWRSGHWHTVKHGQKRQQTKVLWFEPIYVNAPVNP